MSVRLKSPDASREDQPTSKRLKMSHAVVAACGNELDEDLHSRQLAVYGRESMRKMAAAQVLILGLNGLGVEIGAPPPCSSVSEHSGNIGSCLWLASLIALSNCGSDGASVRQHHWCLVLPAAAIPDALLLAIDLSVLQYHRCPLSRIKTSLHLPKSPCGGDSMVQLCQSKAHCHALTYLVRLAVPLHASSSPGSGFRPRLLCSNTPSGPGWKQA